MLCLMRVMEDLQERFDTGTEFIVFRNDTSDMVFTGFRGIHIPIIPLSLVIIATNGAFQKPTYIKHTISLLEVDAAQFDIIEAAKKRMSCELWYHFKNIC